MNAKRKEEAKDVVIIRNEGEIETQKREEQKGGGEAGERGARLKAEGGRRAEKSGGR